MKYQIIYWTDDGKRHDEEFVLYATARREFENMRDIPPIRTATLYTNWSELDSWQKDRTPWKR